MIETKIENGDMTFEYTIQVQKTAMIWSRVLFNEVKKEQATERRKALENKQMDKYSQIFKTMQDEANTIQESVLAHICEKIGVNDEKLAAAIQTHVNQQSDPEKIAQIRSTFKGVQFDNGEGLNEEERNVFVNRDATMDKEEVMRLKALH